MEEGKVVSDKKVQLDLQLELEGYKQISVEVYKGSFVLDLDLLPLKDQYFISYFAKGPRAPIAHSHLTWNHLRHKLTPLVYKLA